MLLLVSLASTDVVEAMVQRLFTFRNAARTLIGGVEQWMRDSPASDPRLPLRSTCCSSVGLKLSDENYFQGRGAWSNVPDESFAHHATVNAQKLTPNARRKKV